MVLWASGVRRQPCCGGAGGLNWCVPPTLRCVPPPSSLSVACCLLLVACARICIPCRCYGYCFRVRVRVRGVQKDMSRDREGAVVRARGVVAAVCLTRSREGRCSVFGQASRGRESAGASAVGVWRSTATLLHGRAILQPACPRALAWDQLEGGVPPHPRPLSPVSRGRGEDFVFLVLWENATAPLAQPMAARV